VGPLDGEVLHHLCEQKDCVNPFHMQPATVAQHNTIHAGDRVQEVCSRCGSDDWASNGPKRRCRPCWNAKRRQRRARV